MSTDDDHGVVGTSTGIPSSGGDNGVVGPVASTGIPSTGDDHGAAGPVPSSAETVPDLHVNVDVGVDDSAALMIKSITGTWSLFGKTGDYAYNKSSGELESGGRVIGC